MILVINTVLQNKTLVALIKSNVLYKKSIAGRGSDKILVLFNKMLEKINSKVSDLKGIVVVSGPGPFTSTRQGVVVANTFGFLLKIPVVGVSLDEFEKEKNLIGFCNKKMGGAKRGRIVMPFYGREPNITKSKKFF